MDYSSDVLDEIALEGLDGITVDGLWLRLSKRPDYLFAKQVINSNDVKQFLWKLVRRLRFIRFYCLEEPRKPLNIFERYTIDQELGVITETNLLHDDIYPYNLIDKDGIVGSCSTYDSREDVTADVQKLDLNSIVVNYGDRLVIVADQDVRRRALIGSHRNPNLEISPIQYCILERIGRSRYHGEPTQGKLGLSVLREDPKTIFYLRKHLLKKKLIMKQCYQNKSSMNMSGLLLHLPRFYRFYKPKYLKMIDEVLEILSKEPNNFIDYNDLRVKLTCSLKRLTKVSVFQKFFDSDSKLPYQMVYPNSDSKFWKLKTDKDKMVRVVQLRKPYVDTREVKKALLTVFDEDDEDEDTSLGILDSKNRFIDVSLMSQCCYLLKDRGVNGLSQTEIAKGLGLGRIPARTITKNLVKIGAIGMYLVDIGRQRLAKYFLKHSISDEQIKLMFEGNIGNESLLSNALEESNCSLESSSEEFSKESIPKELNIVSNETPDCSYSKGTNSFGVNDEEDKVISSDNNNSIKRKATLRESLPLVSNVVKRAKLEIHEKEISWSTENVIPSNEIRIEEHEEIKQESSKASVDVSMDKIFNNVYDSVFNEMSITGKFSCATLEKPVKDAEKINIQVTMTDSYQWLIPKSYKNEEFRILSKPLKTLRLLKRSNLIVEAVRKFKVINEIHKLLLLISETEYREGLSTRIDKKSLLRILYKLAAGEHIKVYRATLKHGDKVLYLNFICNTDILPDDPMIQSTIEFHKLKFHTVSSTKPSVPNFKRAVPVSSISFEKRTKFSHYPKFNRMKITHRFLFSLIYDYTGSQTLDQDFARSKIKTECNLSDEDVISLPHLYLSKIDERMFVPPLPKYTEQGEETGWCLLSDILVRLPLTLFVRLVQIPYHIPELDEFMNHPVKKYYLVNHLPAKIRNCITATRKYIFSIHDVMVKLVYIGLLQFGAQHNKDKDQIFMYFNRNTSLLDTTLSAPGYNKVSAEVDYPLQYYQFDSLESIDEYWHNCWKICMNTRLGGKSFVIGSDIIVENIQDKPDMMNATRSREFMEAPALDTGYVPGDKLGAAGFDSALYAHLKRNWFSKSRLPYECGKSLQIRKMRHLISSSVNTVNRPLKRKLSESSSSPKQTIPKPTAKQNKVVKFSSPTNRANRKRKPKVKVHRVNPVEKSLHRKPYYDQVDKEALKRMRKLRVDWSSEEDRVLLICKVASAFICPDTRKQINANMFLAFREILHKTLQSSKNKTSRACQRRVAYMLRSASTRHNIDLCIEELKQDKYIVKKYGDTLEHISQEAKLEGKRIADMGNFWQERFKGLVSDLMSRYSNYNSFSSFTFSIVNDNHCMLPDDLEECYNKYNLQCVEKKHHKPKDVFKPVAETGDIYSSILNTLIHSTLSCDSDKTSWSYHLFSIYQQYPEQILRNTLNRLRENQMVSYKKSYQVHSSKTGNSFYLPLTASPYQLSISYVNLIQTKYQSILYKDCYELFNGLFQDYKNKNDPDDKGYELLSATGGSAAAVVELYTSDVIKFNIEIPNQVIVLDPNVKDKDESYTRLVQRYKDVLTSYKANLTSSCLFQKDNYLPQPPDQENSNYSSEDEDGDNDNKDSNNTRAVHNVAKAASRIALYMMNDDSTQNEFVPKDMDHVYEFFVVNSCRIFTKLNRNLEELTSREQFLDYNIIDDKIIKSTLQTIRDSAVFSDIDVSDVDNDIPTCSKKDDEDCYKIKVFDDKVLKQVIERNFEDIDIDLVEQMLVKIKAKNDLGLTNSELANEFGNCSKTVELSSKLINLSFILKTGSVETRYVHYSCVRPWLLHSYRNLRYDRDSRLPVSIKDIELDDDQVDKAELNADESKTTDVAASSENSEKSEGKIDVSKWRIPPESLNKLTNHKMTEPVRVVMRPWIRVDSSLNRRILDAILTSVLNHIMMFPGSSLASIQHRFSPAYQPFHIQEICDILIKLNCIYRYTVKIKNKPSLFSKPCEVSVDSSSTGLESINDIRYEADQFAIINLGIFLNTKPYSKDFIECLLGRKSYK